MMSFQLDYPNVGLVFFIMNTRTENSKTTNKQLLGSINNACKMQIELYC